MTESRCLLLKTKDKRKFLTHQKNLPMLVEFSKTFGVEVFLVDLVSSEKILELKALAPAICDSTYTTDPKYKVIEKIHPKPSKTRQRILKNAMQIRAFIKKRLLDGKPVSLKDLKKKYKKWEVTDACLCNHLSAIRKFLIREGHQVNKLGAGTYCLISSPNASRQTESV